MKIDDNYFRYELFASNIQHSAKERKLEARRRLENLEAHNIMKLEVHKVYAKGKKKSYPVVMNLSDKTLVNT